MKSFHAVLWHHPDPKIRRVFKGMPGSSDSGSFEPVTDAQVHIVSVDSSNTRCVVEVPDDFPVPSDWVILS